MIQAYIDAADLRFPAQCIRCDTLPTTTHEISARRGIDLIFVATWEFIEIPVPICDLCKRRRRVAGVVMWVGTLVFILGGGFLAFVLAMNEWKATAALLGAAILAVALGGRMRGDEVLEWLALGARVDYLRGDGAPLRLSFRRPSYAAAWSVANPRAVASRDLLQPQRIMEENTSPADTTFSRRIPGITLIVSVLLIALHHWNAVTNHQVYSVVLLLLATIAGLALGGTIYPPIFYAGGKYGKHLPTSIKIVAALSAIAGFAAGMAMLFLIY